MHILLIVCVWWSSLVITRSENDDVFSLARYPGFGHKRSLVAPCSPGRHSCWKEVSRSALIRKDYCTGDHDSDEDQATYRNVDVASLWTMSGYLVYAEDPWSFARLDKLPLVKGLCTNVGLENPPYQLNVDWSPYYAWFYGSRCLYWHKPAGVRLECVDQTGQDTVVVPVLVLFHFQTIVLSTWDPAMSHEARHRISTAMEESCDWRTSIIFLNPECGPRSFNVQTERCSYALCLSIE